MTLASRILTACAASILFISPCFGQDVDVEATNRDRLKVFLDCNRCDETFIRQELTYINYVRDRQDADMHILVTTQSTGSGGTEYELNFIGQGDFERMGSTLTYASGGTDTDDERRRGLMRTIVMGLVPALSQTSMADQLDVRVNRPREAAPPVVVDKWNDWVFRIGLNGSGNGQESRNTYKVGSSFSATRTTEDWKINVRFNGEYEERRFNIDEETEVYTRRDGTFSALIAKSMGPRWAVGLFAEANTSSFENTDMSAEIAPAVEYNLYPYSESSRREFRFTYRMNLRTFRYEEETIYGQTEETRLNQSLEASYEVNQAWGNVDASLEFSHYLHEFAKNQISLFLRLEFQVIRGLSFNVFGRVSRTHDQLFLAADDPTNQEILLDQLQLATSYDYRVSLGLSYRFGSIFNNVVNSRFGSQGGGGGFGGGGGYRR